MKELTIEEKAKRYDEALERATKLYENANGMILKKWVEQVFPALAESEDERIKRVIKQVLYEFTTEKDECYLDNGVTQQEVFAWLEKQGEQPKKHDVCDNCDQQGSCVSPCPMKLVEKQGEKDEEILILKDQIESLHAAIKALKEVHIIELEKQEWSKEDEEKMVSIFLGIETFCPSIIYGNGKEELLNWLKSRRPQNRWISVDKEVYVKEPVLAQKKDKSDQFEGIVVCCDHTLTPNVYERYMILGDIVPQKQWKPSDEQMITLRQVISGCSYDVEPLVEMEEQLKKLKG